MAVEYENGHSSFYKIIKMKYVHPTFLKILLFSLISLATTSCDREVPHQDRIFGPAKPMGKGMVRSFIESDKNGRPEKVAIIFPESALSELPGTNQILEIKLPFKKKDLALDHVILSWQPTKSDSPNLLTRPYFDIHFNMIPNVNRRSLGSNKLSGNIAVSNFLPAMYVSSPGLLPVAKMKLKKSASPGAYKEDVVQTYKINYFDEKLISYGSEISLDYLMKKGTKTYDISIPEAYQRSGKYYPTQICISYDHDKKQFAIGLMNFKRILNSPPSQKFTLS